MVEETIHSSQVDLFLGMGDAAEYVKPISLNARHHVAAVEDRESLTSKEEPGMTFSRDDSAHCLWKSKRMTMMADDTHSHSQNQDRGTCHAIISFSNHLFCPELA